MASTTRRYHDQTAWANLIPRRPGDVYAYFNNDWQGFAIANTRTLRSLLRRAPTRRDDHFFVGRFACSLRSATSPVGSFSRPARSRSWS